MAINSMVPELNSVSAYAHRVLTGAALDEIRVHSTQLWLRFLNDRLAIGKLIAVDLVFGCAAYMVEAGGHHVSEGIDFFEQRSSFLAEVYKYIGQEINGAEVSNDGRLFIDMGAGKTLVLRPSEQDLENDDSIWRLAVEDKQGAVADLPYAYCVSDGQTFEVGLGRKRQEAS